jgi:hypothetical protein
VMEIPVRMRQTRMHSGPRESPPGFKCQTRSTSAANKQARKLLGWRTDESERIRLETETRYLEVLRRELANVIVSDDPNKMVAAWRHIASDRRMDGKSAHGSPRLGTGSPLSDPRSGRGLW